MSDYTSTVLDSLFLELNKNGDTQLLVTAIVEHFHGQVQYLK